MRIRSVVLGMAVLVLLAGCAEALPNTHPPGMTFDNFQTVEINVARIEVQDNYKPPMRDPNVEHLFPIPPYAAAENLAKRQACNF